MARQYSAKNFIRKVPNRLLQQYFRERRIDLGIDWDDLDETDADPVFDALQALPDGQRRYVQAVSELSKVFALAVPHEQAMAIRDEVGLFQEIRSALVKATVSESERSPEEMEAAIRQLVSRAVYSTEVVDIFAVAGAGQGGYG